MFTMDDQETAAATRILRARFNRSARTRREWVRYSHDVEALRRIARGQSLI